VCIDEVSTSPESFPAKTKLDFTYYTLYTLFGPTSPESFPAKTKLDFTYYTLPTSLMKNWDN
jgi:hypothetical protein